MPHRARPQSGTRSKLSYCAALAQNTRQYLDQTVHVGFLADERRQETQRMGTRSVNHGTGSQRAGNNIMRVARGIIQIAAEHQATATHLYHMRKQLPPKVEPWSPGLNTSAISFFATTAPMGTPSAMPLARLIMSGSTP